MSEFQLYCFAQSGNAYRAALMLNLIGADWQPVYVDFFKGGETRTPKYRADVNEMGEVPVLVHGKKKLTQSGVILTYLAKHSGKFRRCLALGAQGHDERRHLRRSCRPLENFGDRRLCDLRVEVVPRDQGRKDCGPSAEFRQGPWVGSAHPAILYAVRRR